MQKLRLYKPRGGRFYINEHGKVWTNAQHLINWRRAEAQIRGFTARQKNLLDMRTKSTGLYPVYVCDYDQLLTIDLDDFQVEYANRDEEDIDLKDY